MSKGLTGENQRYELDMLQKMNRRHAERREHDPELEARIAALELAFRMQVKAPEAFEVEKESAETKKLYGLDNPVTRDFGWQCLLARRLSERGVRFVQCTHRLLGPALGPEEAAHAARRGSGPARSPAC